MANTNNKTQHHKKHNMKSSSIHILTQNIKNYNTIIVFV